MKLIESFSNTKYVTIQPSTHRQSGADCVRPNLCNLHQTKVCELNILCLDQPWTLGNDPFTDGIVNSLGASRSTAYIPSMFTKTN